jgi:hypothetical protein
VIDLFVRINSTGKALSAAEKRHAKYFNSHFLQEAGRLASKHEKYLKSHKILTDGQISRMKHVELMCELMASIQNGDVINKKVALDSMMKPNSVTERQAKKLSSKVTTVFNRINNMFPNLHQTRFRQISDFYSLATLISRFEEEELILTDKKKNALANDLVIAFSIGVDILRERQKKAQGGLSQFDKYREYLLTVTNATDEYSQRKKREIILRGLLETIFMKKDSERLFSPEQRRIIWNSSEERLCEKCKKPVTWQDFTVDHIKPYSKGGETKLTNAAIMHQKCNSQKGNH